MGVCVKKSDVILFVIINISTCNLIIHIFLVTVTNYSYFYFVINYVIQLHVTSYSPTLVTDKAYQS